MTPKEKAKELVDKFYKKIADFEGEAVGNIQWLFAQESAIICVDEILKNDSMGISYDFNQLVCDTDWWQEVKQEIEKL